MPRAQLPPRRPLLPLLLLLAGLASPALALKTDAQQVIDVQAGRGESAMRDGRTNLGGGVQIQQGSMRAAAQDAEILTQAGAITSVLLTGSPATLAQTMDDGQQLDAEALKIRYDVAVGLVVLEGNAKVRRGTIDRFEGARIEYEPGTAMVRADGQGAGPVTFRFQPSKPAGTAPAESTTPAPAPTEPPTTPEPPR